jgi:eukaryotic-like serine/threonine-protein kinase
MASEALSGVELRTGSAPPFHALLSTPPEEMVARRDRETPTPLPVVPGYEVAAELGRGGMGVVYKARQCSLGRWVALKMILAGAHADPAARARFRTEAEAVARLQHPNVVQAYEVGEHDGRPFLALEYVPGGSLGYQWDGAEREAARVVEAVARAVHQAHQRGVLHRDLKPNNVLLTDDGTPKVADFGLAKLVDQCGGPTRTESLLGTPGYMAPEQAAGDFRKIGVSADVYSLGAILYELLTGRPPFRGASQLETLEQVRIREPVPPTRLRRSISPDLETICLRCLEKEPGNRYSSAGELAEELRRFLDGEPIRARPVPVWRRLCRAVRRRPALIARIVCAAALLAVLIVCGWYFRVAGELDRQRAEDRYRQFVRRRDDALLYGLLAPDQGTLLLGGDSTANWKKAESAARDALDLAGVDSNSEAPVVDLSFPPQRRPEIAADSYTLLLVLASVRMQQSTPDSGDKERYRNSLRLLDSARKLGLETRAYHSRRAHLLERLGEHEEARRERDGSPPPEGALDHFLVGEEQYRRSDWAGAATSFNRALTSQPDHFWSRFFLAVCHLRSRQWEAARTGLNACLGRRPDFVWAYLFRSFANEQLGAASDAESDFRNALRLNPNEDARYVLLLTRGVLHFRQEELDRAAADFRSAATLKPDQYNAYFNLAHVHLARGEFEPAAEQAQTTLRLRPPAEVVFGYHVERGRRLLHLRRYEDAIRACDDALELIPDQPLSHAVRGRALLALGRHREAEGSFDQYLTKAGEPAPDAFRGRGLARMRLGKYPEAAEDYTRALERGPDAELYQHRGWAYFFSDARRLALRDFSKAIELDSGASDAFTGRGLAQVMLGEYRVAVADAEAALRLVPSTPEMMHNVACIFAQAAARAEVDGESVRDLTEDYRRRAVVAVRRTLDMLPREERAPFWRDKIVPDPALAPLRHDAQFKRLQEEYLRSSCGGR